MNKVEHKATRANILQFANEDTKQATFKGTTYKKQVAKFGEWVNPDYPWFSDDPIMTLDEEWANQVIKNFNDNVLGSQVTVPINHTDDANANAGVVKSLSIVKGKGLFADIEILDDSVKEKLDKGLIFDVSISFAWDYISQADGKHYGPTLIHVALVNTPYLIGMDSFEKVGAALSKLGNSLFKRDTGLALNSREGVIMLSRTKIKELSKETMKLSKIVNDKEFDVTVKVTRDSEEVEEVVKAGETIEVPEEQEADVTTQIEEAVAPTEDEEETKDEENKDEEENKDDTNSDDEEVEDQENKEETSEEKLARVTIENSEYKIKEKYSALLSKGLVIPAQEAKIVGLAKLGQGVELSTGSGKKVDLASVVFDILEAGVAKFSTDENGSSDEEDEDETKDEEDKSDDETKKPSEGLSEAERAGFQAVGADPQKMDELAEKDPVFREALANLSKSKKGKK